MTDPILLVREADPARDAEPTAAQIARMDAELERARVAPPMRVRRRRRAGLAFAVAAALAVGVAALPSKAPRRLAPAPASAATVLADLGRKVAAAPAQEGRYAYLRSLSYSSHMRPRPGGKGTFVVVIPMESEIWALPDGDMIVSSVMHEDQARFPTPQDKADYGRAPKQPPWDQRPHEVKGLKIGGLTAAQVLALPADPVALHAAIAGNGMAITAAAGQLLGSPLTPQPVKAALYRVLRDLPGATLVGDQTDPLGRTGVGVRFDDPAWTSLFLFDPGTGALLGVRSIGKKEVPGRDISDWSLNVESGRRDSAPEPVGPVQQW
jgi:hypothetical protein